MPELPEVETTRRGIEPHVLGRRVTEVIVRHRGLRLPVSETLETVTGDRITAVRRRAKYLLLDFAHSGTLLIHLGMSGSLRLSPVAEEFRKHDHVALSLDPDSGAGLQLRFHDPRRFGIFLHLPPGEADPLDHALLAASGPEPLSGDSGNDFTPAHLAKACATRQAAIKLVIMDNKVVVGVGNIYASEALFRAGILPQTPAAKVSRPRLAKLVTAIQAVLSESIEQGGTTLRDFLHSTGEPGYFRQRLFVYDRTGEPCRVCSTPIRQEVLGQRSTYWCPKCQK